MRILAHTHEAQTDWADAPQIYEQFLRIDPNNSALQSKIKELSEKREPAAGFNVTVSSTYPADTPSTQTFDER
jgi:hypothetical protein